MDGIKNRLRHIGPVPRWAKAARTGQVAKGPGGQWLPQALEIATGCYVASVFAIDLEGDSAPACIRAPVWNCPDTALAAAEVVARGMAE